MKPTWVRSIPSAYAILIPKYEKKTLGLKPDVGISGAGKKSKVQYGARQLKVCLSVFGLSFFVWPVCLSMNVFVCLVCGVCVFVPYLCLFVVSCRSDRAPQAFQLFK
jgi:hypothetical protein